MCVRVYHRCGEPFEQIIDDSGREYVVEFLSLDGRRSHSECPRCRADLSIALRDGEISERLPGPI